MLLSNKLGQYHIWNHKFTIWHNNQYSEVLQFVVEWYRQVSHHLTQKSIPNQPSVLSADSFPPPHTFRCTWLGGPITSLAAEIKPNLSIPFLRYQRTHSAKLPSMWVECYFNVLCTQICLSRVCTLYAVLDFLSKVVWVGLWNVISHCII